MIFWSCFRNISAINESESHLLKKAEQRRRKKLIIFHQKAPIDWINIELYFLSDHFEPTTQSLAVCDEMKETSTDINLRISGAETDTKRKFTTSRQDITPLTRKMPSTQQLN